MKLEKMKTSSIERRTSNAECGASPVFPSTFSVRCSLREVHSASRGFSLMELIVVVGVIALLASMIFPIATVVKKAQKLGAAKAEMSEFETAIEAYKARIGAYPPDNPGNAVTNQLYYELQGMIFNQGKGGFTTLDGSVTLTPANLAAAYGPNVTGFMNASGTSRNSDETSSAVNFLKTGLRPNQVSLLSNGANLLVCSVPWESPDPTNVIVPSPPAPPFPKINPWRYVSTNPTNNPGRYDLWVDLYLRGKIYRVNNWSKEPLLVNP